MIYDPNRLPFWEIERRDGPFTRLKWCHEKRRFTDRNRYDFSSLSGPDSVGSASITEQLLNNLAEKIE